MGQARYKNGKIELLRFLFAISVVLYHCQKHFMKIDTSSIHLAFFKRGYIGVEFFFLLTGFFMAQRVYKSSHDEQGKSLALEKTCSDLGVETVQYVWHKIKAILPYHFVSFGMLLIVAVVMKQWSSRQMLGKVLDTIPNLLLIHKIGFDYYSLNRVEWYLSCMFFALLILYPICRRYYSMFVHVIAPAGGIFLLGYLAENFGTFTNVNRWNGFMFICMIRAIAEIAIGAATFEISRVISEKRFSSSNKCWLTLLEWCGYLLIALYIMSTASTRYEIYIVFLMIICIALAFSGQVYGANLFQNRLCTALGGISLPIYLGQVLALDFTEYAFCYAGGKKDIDRVSVNVYQCWRMCIRY